MRAFIIQAFGVWIIKLSLISLEFIQLAKDFEDFRKKWQRTDQELGKYKDLLMKAETERSALDVKLKHARNQVDVEIKRRQRAEADCEKLVCIVFYASTVTLGEGEASDNVGIF